MRPAPTIPTEVTGWASFGSGAPAGRLPLRDELERVDARAHLVGHDEVRQGLVLGREGLVLGRGAGRGQEVERAVGRGPRPVRRPRRAACAHRRRPRPTPGPGRARGARRPWCRARRRRSSGSRLEEVGGLEQRVGQADLERLLGLERLVGARTREDDVHGLLDADEARHDVRAAPAGDQAEAHLGERERGGVGRDRAVVAVERYLEAAAQGEAVDEGERRHAHLRRAGR